MTIRFDRLGTCTEPVTTLIEAYSPKDGRAHGSLDVTLRSCAACHQGYRTKLYACGMTPYSFTPVATHVERPDGPVPVLCGDRTLFGESEFSRAYT